MKWIMCKGDHLDVVGNNHSMLVFAQTTVIMEVNPSMDLTL